MMVFIGRYHCGTNWTSITKQTRALVAQRSTARTNIHALGDNIWQFDFCMLFTIWLLYLVEFADWNSQATIGYGCGSRITTGVELNGYTDSMPYHTGTIGYSRTEYNNGIQYRNIENLWALSFDWLDGCYNSSVALSRVVSGPATTGTYIILNPANFNDSSGGTILSADIAYNQVSSGYPSKFVVADNPGFPLFYPTTANGSDSTYSCDIWRFISNNSTLYCGASKERTLNTGLFFIDCVSSSSAISGISARLQELP